MIPPFLEESLCKLAHLGIPSSIPSEWQIVSRTFTSRFLSRRERSRCATNRRERSCLRSCARSNTSHRSASYRHLAANHVISADIVEPASIELMSVDVELNSKVFSLLDVELLDAVFAEDAEKTLAGILTRNFDNVILRHPVVSCTSRNATLSGQNGDNSTC